MKKLNFKKQSGMTLFGMLVTAIMVISLIIFGGQIGFAYIKKFNIQNNIEAVLGETRSSDRKSVAGVRMSLMKRFDINSIDIPREEINVREVGGKYIISVNHVEEIKVTNDIYILVDISVNTEEEE